MENHLRFLLGLGLAKPIPVDSVDFHIGWTDIFSLDGTDR